MEKPIYWNFNVRIFVEVNYLWMFDVSSWYYQPCPDISITNGQIKNIKKMDITWQDNHVILSRDLPLSYDTKLIIWKCLNHYGNLNFITNVLYLIPFKVFVKNLELLKSFLITRFPRRMFNFRQADLLFC